MFGVGVGELLIILVILALVLGVPLVVLLVVLGSRGGGPPGAKTSAAAIASLVLALVPLVVTNLAGLVLGVVALVRINARPAELKGKGLAIAAIVVGAIGTLVGLLVVAGMVAYGFSAGTTPAKNQTARTQLQMIGEALELYRLNTGRYPSAAEGLRALAAPSPDGPILESVPRDPWGNDYVYLFPGRTAPDTYELTSFGADGISGGGDDITHTPSR
jgi:general secretion pathway protein G